MDKQTQDLAWACLPKEAREEIRKQYRIVSKNPQLDRCDSVYLTALEIIFGRHNLTSDTEPEVRLMVSKSKVMERIKYLYSHPAHIAAHKADERASELRSLFGDQYLSDTPNTPNSGELKKQSVEGQPKFKIGDKVRVLGGLANKDMEGKMAFVTRLPKENCNRFMVTFEDGLWTELPEKYLEPYTEPETKDNVEDSPNLKPITEMVGVYVDSQREDDELRKILLAN